MPCRQNLKTVVSFARRLLIRLRKPLAQLDDGFVVVFSISPELKAEQALRALAVGHCGGEENVARLESDQHSACLDGGRRFLQVFQRQLQKGLHLRLGSDLRQRRADPPKPSPGDVRDIHKKNGILGRQGRSL